MDIWWSPVLTEMLKAVLVDEPEGVADPGGGTLVLEPQIQEEQSGFCSGCGPGRWCCVCWDRLVQLVFVSLIMDQISALCWRGVGLRPEEVNLST